MPEMLRQPSTLLTIATAAALAACGDNHERPAPDAGMTPDAGPGEIPLDRSQSGGWPGAIALAGTHAYVAVGPRLEIWDTSANPPRRLGESHPLRGVINAVAVAGTRAYVAERVDIDSEIHVIDITNPALPTETGSFSVAAEPGGYTSVRDLEAGNGVLYVADQEQGVLEMSLANPDVPSLVRTVPPTGVSGLLLAGTRLYYTAQGFIGGASLGVLDTTDNLKDVGGSGLGNVNGVAVTGTLAVGAGPDGIYVMDVSDPNNPVERFHSGDFEMGPFSRAIAAHGTKAWIPAEDGLYILDLTDPLAINQTGPIAIETVGANAAAATGDTVAYVTDRGRLMLLGASTADQPETARKVDVTLCANCVGITPNEDMLYVADIVGGVRTASTSNLQMHGTSPALPVLTESGLQFVFEDVFAVGTRVFVADWLYGMRVYDVSTPSAPTMIGTLDTPGSPGGITVDGTRAYLAEGTDGGALRVIDVTNPAQPVELGAVPTSKAMDVEVRGTVAYVADESLFEPGGLRILNVTNPSAITQLGMYNLECTSARDVALVGNTAVVACGGDDFHFVDITNPANPTRIAVVHPEVETSAAWSVATYEGHAVLGHDNGVIVTTLGATPQVVKSFATSSSVRAITVPRPGRVIAAAGQGGVYQWNVTD